MRHRELLASGFHLRPDLRRMRLRPMRPVSQGVQALVAISAHPSVHRLNPEPFGNLGHR